MKIFGWMQSKLNAKQVTRKTNTVATNNHMGQASSKEEFSDWPQSLLAIGTFGISNLKTDPETPTSEEVGELFSFLEKAESESVEESESHERPVCEEVVNRDIRLQRSISGKFSRGLDILSEQKNVIRKKSLTFLLKKFFTSRNRFSHASSLGRDSLHTTMEKSRMEKILRAILNKKIHPQSSNVKAMPNKYLENEDVSMDESDDEISEGDDDSEGSMWVKTDSEYIVLEI